MGRRRGGLALGLALALAWGLPAQARVEDPALKLGPDVAKTLATGLEHLGPPPVEVEVWPKLPPGEAQAFAKARFGARRLPERTALLVIGADDRQLGIALGPSYLQGGVSQELAATLASRVYFPEAQEGHPAEGALALATQLHLALRLGRDPLAKDASPVALAKEGTPFWIWGSLGALALAGAGYGGWSWRKASRRRRRKARLGAILERVDALEAVGRRAEPMLAASQGDPGRPWHAAWTLAQAEHAAVAEAAQATRAALRRGAWDRAEAAVAEGEARATGAEARATAVAAASHRPDPEAFLGLAEQALTRYAEARALSGRGGSEERLATARRLLLQSPPDPAGALELLDAHAALAKGQGRSA